jgi:hypothetical protein
MTDQEQREWVAMLGSTPHAQMAVIRELLRHASTDEMSREDRIICRVQLGRLVRDYERC